MHGFVRPDLEMVNANAVKNALLFHFRFDRQWPYIATEWLDCDVVASDGVSLIEVEVKISWADYREEFKKRKYEPWRLQCKSEHRLHPVLAHTRDPNRMYFGAPAELAQRIAADPASGKYGHGVISVDRHGQCKVLKRAKQLHKEPVSEKMLNSIVSRLTSELITLRQQLRA